jgi:serine/threonine protein kinase/Flp pilus assembly protein TadD
MSESLHAGAVSGGIDQQVAEVVAEITDRLHAGEPVDVEQYMARHPELADRLRPLVAALDLLARFSSAAGAERRLERASAGKELSGTLGDFRILREVGHGGMGVVYEAEQISLGRRVALKVLPFAATMDPRHLRRFQNEARAAASLEHPHIVPVYGVGCERGVHYYAMKFIDGQTLASLLQQHRADPASRGCQPPGGPGSPEAVTAPAAATRTQRAPRDSTTFRQIAAWAIQAAEALEHAHSLGVVHRDIKPANLLIDGHGALWVTDYGLARTAADAGLTMTGDVLGTLRYMSPEQALAKHGLVDHRTDIYSLGVTLYELLTGTPAVGGKDREEILNAITLQERRPPRALEAAIPPDLETIVLKAMEKTPTDRYATAQELADDLRRWLDDRPIQARRPSLVQRVRKWGRRHRVAVVATAACLLVTLVSAAGSAGWVARDREARRNFAVRRAGEALESVNTLVERENWPEGLRAVEQAEGFLDGFGEEAALRLQAQQQRRDLEMASRLQEVRLAMKVIEDGDFDWRAVDDAYAAAFQRYGLDIDGGDPQATAEQMRLRPIHRQLVAALDNWGFIRWELKAEGWDRRLAVARAADPDHWRNRLRDALEARDLKALEEAAATEQAADWPAETLVLLGRLALGTDSSERVAAILERAQQRHPDDFWINETLGLLLDEQGPSRMDDAIRSYSVAVALRPQSPGAHYNLGFAFHYKGGQSDRAIAEYREALRLDKDCFSARNCLGNILRREGHLDEAIVEYREMLRQEPARTDAHANLGVALRDKGQFGEAVAELREALRLSNGSDLIELDLRRTEELAQADRRLPAILQGKEQPKDATERVALAQVCQRNKKLFAAATRFYAEAFAAEPALGEKLGDVGGWYDAACAAALAGCGRGADAKSLDDQERARLRRQALAWLRADLTAWQKLLENEPDKARAVGAVQQLGHQLTDTDLAGVRGPEALGKVSEPERRDWQQLWDDVAAVRQRGRGNYRTRLAHPPLSPEVAITKYREAIRRNKDDPLAHFNLGNALRHKGQLGEAMVEYKEAVRLDPNELNYRYCLAFTLEAKSQWDEAIAVLQEALRLKSDNPLSHYNLANALYGKGQLDEAIGAYREALQRARRLDMEFPQAHQNLGGALAAKGQLDEAIAAYREALQSARRLHQEFPEAHCALGQALLSKGEFREAVQELRRGHELGSPKPGWSLPSAQWLREAERFVQLDGRLPAILEDKAQPKDAGERVAFAQLCQLPCRKHYAAAARFYAEAFTDDPALAEKLGEPASRYDAACSAALAGCGQGEDAKSLDDKERARLRRQALDWLRADLAAWQKALEKEPDKAPAGGQQLAHWLEDPDFAGVRGPEALAKLAETEREPWQKLWADVANTLARAQEKTASDKKPDPK